MFHSALKSMWLAPLLMMLIACSSVTDARADRPLPEHLKVGPDLLAGDWENAEHETGKLAVSHDMGDHRRGFYIARWSPRDLGAARNWSKYDGVVLTVTTDQPRTDAWVDVALMEEDGSWYYVRDAAPLSAKSQRVVVPFDALAVGEFVFDQTGTRNGMDGMFDENFHFNLDRVRKIAVGTVNGWGVGEVNFTFTELRLAQWKPEGEREKQMPVDITVTGKTLQVNDQREVPAGMFGYHISGGDVELVAHLRPGSIRSHRAMAVGGSYLDKPDPRNHIDYYVSCQYDRGPNQILFPATHGNWEEISRNIGKSLGEKAKGLGDKAVVEWWNEPYLSFAQYLESHPERYFKTANPREGEPVETKYGRKLKSMVWLDAKGQYHHPRPWRSTEKKPLPSFDGVGKDGQPMKLVARDPSRYDYFAGRQIALFYIDTFNAMAEEAKAISPDMKLVGGYGFRWHEDEWGAWELLVKPLIDSSIEHLDGICEHHYQGDVKQMPAAYEVLQAYTDWKYDKRLKSYNTETNDLWDAPARGNPSAAAQKGGKFQSRKRMVYNLRDILYTLQMTPDKAEARAIHALWKPGKDVKLPIDPSDVVAGKINVGMNKGTYAGMYLMRNLRGQLAQASSSDDDVWVVSSIDKKTGRLVVVIFNDSAETRQIEAEVNAPAGTMLAGVYETIIAHDDDGNVFLSEKSERNEAWDRLKSKELIEYSLPASHAVAYEFLLDGERPDSIPPAQIIEKQCFAEGILKQVEPGQQIDLPIKVDCQPRDGHKLVGAKLRVVLERAGMHEGSVIIAGKEYELPPTYTAGFTPAIREIELPIDDAAKLLAIDKLTFKAAPADVGNGYHLCAASLILTYEKQP